MFVSSEALMRLCGCAGSSESWMLTNAISSTISCAGPYNIRIYHECEGRIEKSVPRITFWHLEACRLMTNGDPEGRNFPSYPHANNGFFFMLTTVFFFIYFIFFLF